MALYTIADLHLSAGVQKPMDIFGGKWQGYMEKIQKNWRAVIQPEDTVVGNQSSAEPAGFSDFIQFAGEKNHRKGQS